MKKLIECEERIERWQRNAFYEIGLDLKEIRDRQLYKQERETPVAGRYSFATFEEYIKQRWDWTPQYANGIIRSVEAVEQRHTEQAKRSRPSQRSRPRSR